ncbi:unnamed protein product [Pleuronectes platessa]|uniref:Uncharacterized protein n=1 Tax=Pleuronectes platessa TaxID=8262 RepID=A0A9N7V1S1_PLEPL|nr:unnamed protein product [Pleuronectes platessa]
MKRPRKYRGEQRREEKGMKEDAARTGSLRRGFEMIIIIISLDNSHLRDDVDKRTVHVTAERRRAPRQDSAHCTIKLESRTEKGRRDPALFSRGPARRRRRMKAKTRAKFITHVYASRPQTYCSERSSGSSPQPLLVFHPNDPEMTFLGVSLRRRLQSRTESQEEKTPNLTFIRFQSVRGQERLQAEQPEELRTCSRASLWSHAPRTGSHWFELVLLRTSRPRDATGSRCRQLPSCPLVLLGGSVEVMDPSVSPFPSDSV